VGKNWQAKSKFVCETVPVRGIRMVVVAIDERGRLTIPSELQVRGTKATLIPAGPFMIIMPIPTRPVEVSGGWLRTKLSRKELKSLAGKQAGRDAVKRAKRRKQL
jgi:hypothetical protein